MIFYIKGILEYISEDFLIVEANGIGYKLFVSSRTISNMPEIGNEVKIFTYMSIREEIISLFGFYSKDELDMFNRLIMVSGVGPKAALAFLAQLSVEEIAMAIMSGDSLTLSKTPGVGKKTAQRVILELKDKFKSEDFIESKNGIADSILNYSQPKFDAISALTSLGYSASDATKAVSQIYDENLSTEQLLKLALKKLSHL